MNSIKFFSASGNVPLTCCLTVSFLYTYTVAEFLDLSIPNNEKILKEKVS